MSEITLTKEDVVKELRNIRATLYHSQAKTKTRRNFKELRAHEQLVTERSWQRQLVALDKAITTINTMILEHSNAECS